VTEPLPPPTLRWEGGSDGRLFIIDQTLLPAEEVEIEIATPEDIADAILRLAVRGAPAIGIAGAYGLFLAARRIDAGLPRDAFLQALDAERAILNAVRPTAVNLGWALDRSFRAAATADSVPAIRAALHAEALAIHEEDRAACDAMARHSLTLIAEGGRYLTHCNAGALATGGWGTALAGFHLAAREGMKISVFADETRPLLQGARLTAWELERSGVDVVVLCDSSAATVLTRGDVDAVFVGSDRIAANGDVANKIGTLSVALAAQRGGVPFYVVAPSSTFDLSLPSGDRIPIEERPAEEITRTYRAFNPAFDVTPAELVTAIVTEKGIIRPVNAASVSAVVSPATP
jgi:methylthioribose-1-phosphate isomerase